MRIRSDFLFTLTLFLVLAFCSLAVVLIGADVYQSTVNAMEENYSSRTALAYVTEKIRQNDRKGGVSVENSALCLTRAYSEASYSTYIYAYDGYLWELTIRGEETYQPGEGQKILEVADFSITQVTDHLYEVFTRIHDQETRVMVSTQCD